MSERQGVEIDYCPKCRGVWLDRGELDKIIERSAQTVPVQPQMQPQNGPQPPLSSHDSHYGYPYKRKKSWLGEIFD
jgi:Zn-finger nucleic acid-binding protein